jgi:predicted nucleic acid-binding protein
LSVYIESSAVSAWLLHEDRRDEVVRAIATTEKILTSALTELEFSRSVTRARVSGRISATEAESVLREFEAEWETWEIMDVT